MALLTTQTMDRAGLYPAGVAVAATSGGDTITNTGREFVYIKNAGGSNITLTLDITATVDGQSVTDRTVSITAGQDRLIGPFPTSYYGTTLTLSYSGVSSVTVAAIVPTTA